MRTRLLLCAVAVLVGCDDVAPARDHGYAVTGLLATEHRPILIYEDVSAWTGLPEELPTLTVYEDGLVIRSLPSGVTSGRIDGSVELARRIADQLAHLDPRMPHRFEDEPVVSIFVRMGEVWRSVVVPGLFADDTTGIPIVWPETAQPASLWANDGVASRLKPIPSAFLDARHTLVALSVPDEKPFRAAGYHVHLSDDSYPSHAASSWPPDIPPPPSLTPNPMYAGRPRGFDLPGDAGASLRSAFGHHELGRSLVRTPDGERVELYVTAAIPDEDYVRRVVACASDVLTTPRSPAPGCSVVREPPRPGAPRP